MSNNKDKFHFFIGNIFKNDEQIKFLKKVQKKLRFKYGLKDFQFNNKFFTNLIYLGYFDYDTATIYMDNIMTPLLESISNNFNVLKCEYMNFNLDFDNVFHNISIDIKDTHNYLVDIIIPYLYNNAITPIYDKEYKKHHPFINILYYKDSTRIKNVDNIKIELPKNTFKIDHLSLIKGTPYKYRAGMPSIHDQLILEEIEEYHYPLKPINSNNNNKHNNRSNPNNNHNNNRSNNNKSNSNNKNIF